MKPLITNRSHSDIYTNFIRKNGSVARIQCLKEIPYDVKITTKLYGLLISWCELNCNDLWGWYNIDVSIRTTIDVTSKYNTAFGPNLDIMNYELYFGFANFEEHILFCLSNDF